MIMFPNLRKSQVLKLPFIQPKQRCEHENDDCQFSEDIMKMLKRCGVADEERAPCAKISLVLLE